MKHLVGIRREDKNRWERRAPLTPANVARLHREHGIGFVVQPSSQRVFPDRDYVEAGAHLAEDLGSCGVVLGVKEMPVSFFRPGQAYVFFAHVVKGQQQNMPMLARMMDLGCSLIDYEKITDDSGRRQVFFGRYAGLAGMLDTLHGLGWRLQREGLRTPFACFRGALDYGDMAHAAIALADVGEKIRKEGLPASLVPLVFGVAGYGNVARGVIEVLEALGAVAVEPESLAGLATQSDRHRVFYAVFREEHMVEPTDRTRRFELEDYYRNPDCYRSRFETWLPHLTVLANCVYWDRRYPRLVTREWLSRVAAAGELRLRVIGDISCDVAGAVEVTVKTTNPGEPFFVFEPLTGGIEDGLNGSGIAILAVDNLPCELPLDASDEFGQALEPYVQALATADYAAEPDRLTLPAPLRRALILHRGVLTNGYGYIQGFIDRQRSIHE